MHGFIGVPWTLAGYSVEVGGIPSSLVRCFDILAYIYCCVNICQETCHFFALNLDTDQNYVFGRALFGAQFTGEIHRVAKSLCFIPGR